MIGSGAGPSENDIEVRNIRQYACKKIFRTRLHSLRLVSANSLGTQVIWGHSFDMEFETDSACTIRIPLREAPSAFEQALGSRPRRRDKLDAGLKGKTRTPTNTGVLRFPNARCRRHMPTLIMRMTLSSGNIFLATQARSLGPTRILLPRWFIRRFIVLSGVRGILLYQFFALQTQNRAKPR